MPLKLNIGLNRKMGEANYGSRGASVNLEIELDSQLVADPGKLQERIRQCFGMVRSSLDEELHGHAAPDHDGSETRPHSANANGNGNGPDTNGSNGTRRSGGQRQATPRQVKAIHAIARSRRLDAARFLNTRFHVSRADDLTLTEASQAIDELKAERESA